MSTFAQRMLIWSNEGRIYWRWSCKCLHHLSRPTAPLNRRDRRAATDLLCGTTHLFDQCSVESTAQTKLVTHAEREIQQ